MRKLMFATALVASAAAFADPLNAISFEGYSADATFTNGTAEKDEEGVIKSEASYGYFFFEGDTDGSSVKAFGSGEGQVAEPTITRPLYFANGAMGKYLELSTEGGILWRSINTLNNDNSGESPVYSLGDPVDIAATGTYLDTLVQFTPTEDGGAPTVDAADKLAIWLNVENNVTNLMVKANLYDFGEAPSATEATFTLAPSVGEKKILPGEWYRLTIKAIPNVTLTDENGVIPVFEIYIDGVQMRATTPQFTAAMVETFTGMNALSEYMTAAIAANKIFPSLAEMGNTGDTPTLQGVGFKGSGALDDIVWTTEDPFDVPAAGFTLTWPAGVTPVSYTIDGGEAVSLSGATSSFPIPGGVVPGSTVAFTFTNADGATKTMSVEASSSVTDIDAANAVYEWADYLGAAVAGAYQIDDANDLDMLRKGVAAGLATVGETFNQTANIDMTSAGAFAGIGTYASNLNKGVPFQGTYDGQGYKISNVAFTKRTYAGIFNQVKGGTIKDLTVENISFPELPFIVPGTTPVTTNEYGGAIVGNAGLGATLLRLEAKGTFGSASYPATHNVAGIAVRVCGGASNVVNGVTMLETLVKDCTNSATLYGNYTKAGGITALTQDQNGVPNDYVKFEGCVNNGTITMAALIPGTYDVAGRDGLAGIVAYTADGTKLKDCVNTGTYSTSLSNAKTAELVAYHQGSILEDLGGNAADAAKKMVHTQIADKIVGFKYATVDNGVATTITGAPVAGGTYLLEGNVAASETPVATLTAVGDTIAFNTALGYTFAGTVDGSAALVVTDSTAGTVTTFAAATAVAQITGGAKFATLQAAVDAATAGDTVTVLADCTITDSLSIAKNLTIHNDYTIAANVNYAICIGATVSFEGSGKIERGSTITGSAFCVGANEKTRGAITVGTAGTLNFTGLTVCGGSGGNLIKLENGTVNMNGGVLKDGLRGIKADADVGTYTSAIVINGGTITNCTAFAVMASAESATGTATLTVNGGDFYGNFQSTVSNGTATITINGGNITGALSTETKSSGTGTATLTIPGTSTAKFNADQTAFCESGYETTDGDNDGWFTVSAVQSAYPTYLENADAAVKANYDTWSGSNGADTGSVYEKQFLLNAAPATEVPATALAITAIEQNATAGWDITVECTISGVDLSGTVGTAKAGNGYLAVSYTDDLTGTWTTENINITASANGKVTVNVNKSGAKFMKVKLSSTAEPQN